MTDVEDLPQDPGPRAGEMVRATPTNRALYHEQHEMTVLREMRGLDQKERKERLDAAEFYGAYLAGDQGVTREEAAREQFRVDAKHFLKRAKPINEFPRTREANAYGVMRYAVEIGRTAPDKNDMVAAAHGRPQFGRWWVPIAREFESIARYVSGLRQFGDDTDVKTCRELLERGEGVSQWLLIRYDTDRARPPTAVPIPFLPRWSLEPAPADYWWWGSWRQTASNVCAWWSKWQLETKRYLPIVTQRGVL